MASPGARKWRSIAEDLRGQILRRELKPGDPLPPEAELVARFGVSRNTIREATRALIGEGLVETVYGRGGGNRVRERHLLTFHASHAEHPGRPAPESDAWATEVRAHGFEPSQDFECHNVKLAPDVAVALGEPEGADAVRRRCIRYVNGQPSSLQDSYYPAWLCDEVPELRSGSDIAQGTTMLLADRGHVQVGYLDQTSARMPMQDEAELLDIGAGTPVLVKTRTACTSTRVVRVTVEVMAGDRNQLEYEIGDVSVALAVRNDQ